MTSTNGDRQHDDAHPTPYDIRRIRELSEKINRELSSLRKSVDRLVAMIPIAAILISGAILWSRGEHGDTQTVDQTMTVAAPFDAEKEALRAKTKLTTTELSKLTGEHHDTIYAKRDRGIYTSEKVGGRLLFENPFLAAKQQ